MITFHCVRDDMPDSGLESKRTVTGALTTLVTFQFGYGGHATGASVKGNQVTLKVCTPVMDHRDLLTFSGSHEEMELLIKAAQFHTLLMQQCGPEMIDGAIDAVNQITNRTLLVTTLVPMVAGRASARVVYELLLADVGGEDAFANHTEELKALELDDLAAVITLIHDDHVTLEEALAMAA